MKVTQKKLLQRCIFFLIAKNPERNGEVKMQQKLFSCILPPLLI